jgi:hypothetical protein
MSVLLITYDFKNEGKRKRANYPRFSKIRDSYDNVRLSESTYAINTFESAETVYNKLKGVIDSDDAVFVVALTRPYLGPAPNVLDWLDRNLPQ